MKTKFTFLFFLAAFCFSCSCLPQVEKRHYRDGFYIGKNRDKKLEVVKKDSVIKKMVSVPVAEIKTCRKFPKTILVHIQKNIPGEKKNFLAKKKSLPVIIPAPIDLPKEEPINKKAKAAVIFLLLAKLMLLSAFIVLLCSLLNVFFLLGGIAALFAFLAIAFGIWAKKEIANETGINKELGAKEANFAIVRAAGGLASVAFIILLAIIVDWIQRQ